MQVPAGFQRHQLDFQILAALHLMANQSPNSKSAPKLDGRTSLEVTPQVQVLRMEPMLEWACQVLHTKVAALALVFLTHQMTAHRMNPRFSENEKFENETAKRMFPFLQQQKIQLRCDCLPQRFIFHLLRL